MDTDEKEQPMKKTAITADTTVEELVERYPAAIGFLMSRGIVCIR